MGFKLKSGNASAFKNLGSSPAKQRIDPTAKPLGDQYKKTQFKKMLSKDDGGVIDKTMKQLTMKDKNIGATKLAKVKKPTNFNTKGGKTTTPSYSTTKAAKGYKPHQVDKGVTFTKRMPGKFVKHKMVEKPLSAKGLKQAKQLKKIGKVTKNVVGNFGKFLGGKALGVASMMMATSSKADQPTYRQKNQNQFKKPDFKAINKDLAKSMYKPLPKKK